MRQNFNFSASDFERNEGEITGMKMDLFCTMETHMWKWSIGHSIQLPANAELLPTIKVQRLSPEYFKIWLSSDQMSRNTCMSPGQYTFFFQFLLLFNYSCMPFLPFPPHHPSWTHLPPPPPPSPPILSMCPS